MYKNAEARRNTASAALQLTFTTPFPCMVMQLLGSLDSWYRAIAVLW